MDDPTDVRQASAVPLPSDRTLAGVVGAACMAHPDRIAVVDDERALTYAELLAAAGAVATSLRASGVPRGRAIGVHAGRSADYVAAIVGVLRCGGWFVPLDPELPPARLSKMAASCDAAAVITDRPLPFAATLALEMPVNHDGGGSCDEDDVEVDPADLAYALFTSGSTGAPKAALLEHRNVVAMLDGLDRVAPASGLVGTTICPFGFDVSIWEIFSVLAHGGTLHVAGAASATDGFALVRFLLDREVCSAYLPPGLLSDVIASLEQEGGAGMLNRVLVGVEPIAQGVLQRLRDLAPDLRIINGYGPTETAICATLFVFTEARDPVAPTPIGFPVHGYSVELHDESGRLADHGEIVIGGDGVGRGYADDPELTRERFGEDPTELEPADRRYRTGDVARRLAGGELVFVGRRDAQVKVRGFRVEPGEVEAALRRQAGVGRALALASRRGAETLLAAFVEGDADPATLRLGLVAELPAHAVPASIRVLTRFPLTRNGKVDTAALLCLAARRPQLAAAPVAPESADERLLQGLWAELLGLDEIGIDDDFTELGGSSLLAMALARRAREATGRTVTATTVTRARTIRGLARELVSCAPVTSPPCAGNGTVAASPAQIGLWTLQQLDPANTAFYVNVALELRGPLDVQRVTGAFARVLDAHDALRTHLEQRGSDRLVQVTQRRVRTELELVDGPGRDARAVAAELVAGGLEHPPQLSAPPWRAWLLRLAADRHVLVLLAHHVVFDGWSARVLVRDLAAALRGETLAPAAGAPALDAADAHERAASYERARARTLERFRPPPAPLELRVDRPRGARRSSHGGRVCTRLEPDTADGLTAVARDVGSSPFTVVLALVVLLAHRYSAQDDLAVCVPVARRDQDGAEDAIGYLVDLLALRIDAAGEPSLRVFVAQVHHELVSAREQAAFPFEDLVRAVAPGAGLSTSPLTRLVVINDVELGTPIDCGDVVIDALELGATTSKYELAAFVVDNDGAIRVAWEYAKDVFDRATVERIARAFGVLARAAAAPGAAGRSIEDLEILDADDRRWVTSGLNPAYRPAAPARGIDELFAEQVRLRPEHVAVAGQRESLTYAELDRRASAVASALLDAGVRPGAPVLVRAERSPGFVVAILGALRAGGYYVPIDARLPAPRLAAIIAATGARVAVVGDPAALARHNLVTVAVDPPPAGGLAPARRGPDDPAYAMFTSGSTGSPKGVLVPDRAVVRLVCKQPFLPVGPQDVFLHHANAAFDAATLELWGPLLNGARVVLVDEDVVRDPAELAVALKRHRVTIGFFNVTVFQRILATSPGAFASFHTLLVGGEAVPEPVMRRAAELLGPDVLLNGYGPTENTTFSCVHRLDGLPAHGMPIPIGRPIAGSTAYVVDQRLRPVPLDAVGEIVVGGAGVALGYIGDPRLTSERFVADPFAGDGSVLYRTGDRGRVRPDLTIEFSGRIDDQVKVRGFRVELSEVQLLLERVPGVRRAIALAPESEHGRRLIGFVEVDAPVAGHEIQAALRGVAPDYLVPAQVVTVDHFPATPNGKVDREALLQLWEGAARPTSDAPLVRSEAARRMAAIWSELLGVAEVPADVGFFEVGGDSLLLIVLRDRIEREFGVRLAVTTLLEHPTVALLTAQVGGEPPPAALGTAHERAARRAERRNARRPSEQRR